MAAAPIPWNLANDPIDWDVIGINWDTAAKSESETFAASVTQAVSERLFKLESFTLTANVSESLDTTHTLQESLTLANNLSTTMIGGPIYLESFSLGVSADQATVAGLAFLNSVTFTVNLSEVNATNHQESITIPANVNYIPGDYFFDSISMAATADQTVADSFLWTEKDDVTTTWTKLD